MDTKIKENIILHVLISTLETGVDLVDGMIYKIGNDISRNCMIGYTTNLYLALGRLFENIKVGNLEYKNLKEDLPNVNIQILETGVKKEDLKLRHSYWYNYFKELNYRFYKDCNPLQYKLSTEFTSYRGRVCYFVYLKNKRKDKLLVGRFYKKKEMTNWIQKNYPDTSRIYSIVIDVSAEA
jgi:hypothetical protein